MTTKELITLTEIKKHKDTWNTSSVLIAEINGATFGQVNMAPVDLRAVIQNLRAIGEPIIASEKGYKYTTSIKELKDYCELRRREINKELAILGSMELKVQEGFDKKWL